MPSPQNGEVGGMRAEMQAGGVDRSAVESLLSESEASEDVAKWRGCVRQRGIFLQVAATFPTLVVLAWLSVVYVKSQAAAHVLLAALHGEDLGGIELEFGLGDAPPGTLTVLQDRAGRSRAGEAAAVKHRGREIAKRFQYAVSRALREAQSHPNASLIFGHASRHQGSNEPQPTPDAALRRMKGTGWVDEFMRQTMTKNLMNQLDFMNSQVEENSKKQSSSDSQLPPKPGDPIPKIDRLEGPASLEFTSFICAEYINDLDGQTAFAALQLRGQFRETLTVMGRVPMGDSVDRPGILSYPFKIEMHDIVMCACEIKAFIRISHPSIIEKFSVGFVFVGMGKLEGTMYSKYENAQKKIDWYTRFPTIVCCMETAIMNKRLAKDKDAIIAIYSKQFHTNMQKEMDAKTPESMEVD